MELQNIVDDMMCWCMAYIQMWDYLIHCYVATSFKMASTSAMASGVNTRCTWRGRGDSVTELMSFMNFLIHSYTCCSDRHASPYWTFICLWISMGFTFSMLTKRMRVCCSFLVHVACGAAIFTLLLRRRVPFLLPTATCQSLFKPWI